MSETGVPQEVAERLDSVKRFADYVPTHARIREDFIKQVVALEAAIERQLLASQEAVQAVLQQARAVLAECNGDYNHPMFTDRHGTGLRTKMALETINEVLSPSGDPERTPT